MSKNNYFKNILMLLTGTALAQLIPLFSSPFLTRLYDPVDFGILATYLGIASVLAVICTARYELAILLPKKNIDAFMLYKLSMYIVFVTFIFYSLSLCAIDVFLDVKGIYFTIPLLVVFIGLNNIFDKFNNRHKNYKLMSAQRIIKASIESGVSVILGLYFINSMGMIIGLIAGFLVSSMVMFCLNLSNQKWIVDGPSYRSIAIEFKSFPLYSMPHGLLNTLVSNTPVFIIPYFYDATVLGYYAFGLKIVQAPFSLMAGAVYNVLAQRMAEIYKVSGNLNLIFKQTLYKLIALSFLSVPFFIFLDDIFFFVFGAEWEVAGSYLQILSPWIILVFIASPFASIPHIFNKQREALLIEIVSFTLRFLALVAGGIFYSIEVTLFMLMFISSLISLYTLYWYGRLISLCSEQAVS